jgi:hypothetical protein
MARKKWFKVPMQENRGENAMSRFRFSRWLAGSSSLLAVVLITAGGASAQTITLWDFAALLGNNGPCEDLGASKSVPQTGFGSIELSSPLPLGVTLTVKGGNLLVGASERGLGLSQPLLSCVGDEVGDGGTGTLLMNFDNVQPFGSTVTSVQLGSLQPGECYRVSISTDLGVTFGAPFQACDGDSNFTKTLDINLPTDGLVLKFEKATQGTGDNDYVVNSVTTSFVAGICHNIGGPRELGANCDASGCTVNLAGGGTLDVLEGEFLGIIVPFNTLSEGALNAHIKHGDGPILSIFDPPLHLASTGQIHLASNVECLGVRTVPQPPDHGN